MIQRMIQSKAVKWLFGNISPIVTVLVILFAVSMVNQNSKYVSIAGESRMLPTCASSCPNPFPSPTPTSSPSPTPAEGFCTLLDCILDHCTETDLGAENHAIFQDTYDQQCD